MRAGAHAGRRRSERRGTGRARVVAGVVAVATLLGPLLSDERGASASHLVRPSAVYTDAADFSEGELINLVNAGGELKLADEVEPFPFLWVAVSTKGTVVKVDTRTGEVLGEYLSSPAGMQRDPSRTTVDKNGNVWVANRQEAGLIPDPSPKERLKPGPSGSIVHIGLEENGQCDDRNDNGVIDTSRGFNDVKAWSNVGGADTFGGVSTAQDECIVHYVRVNSTGTRHVSVTKDNDVWVSGTGERDFDLVDSATGAIDRAEPSFGCGGYGGLIDAAGVIWSARPLLRWDTTRPRTEATCNTSIDSYGIGVDSGGNVWVTALCCNRVYRFGPDGSPRGFFPHGNDYAQGVVVDRNDHVWVAHSLLGCCASPNSVGHLRPTDGSKDAYEFAGNVAVGVGPTGVSVDAAGKVWATNYGTGDASRIDPTLAGGVGAEDLRTRHFGGNLYNYSDMTGSVLRGAPSVGRWTVVHDSGAHGHDWQVVSWNAEVPADAELAVAVSASDDGTDFGAPVAAVNGGALTGLEGRYLRVTVSFTRGDESGESPLLLDLAVGHRATSITAEPAIAHVRQADATILLPGLTARLVETAGDAPLAGRTIHFRTVASPLGGPNPVCSADTDDTGVASCSGLLMEHEVVLGLGYEAVFEGDDTHGAAKGSGPLVRARIEL